MYIFDVLKKIYQRYLAVTGLLTLCLVGLFLRLYHLDNGIWLDEILTYKRAKATVASCLATLSAPVHEVLTHFSLQIADNEFFFRLPNVFVGVAGIVVMYFVMRAVTSRAGGLLGAALLTFSSFHVHHSQWARYYALLMLAGLLWAYFMHRLLVEGGRWYAVGYVFTCFWALLTHLFALPYLAAMNVGAALWIGFSPSIRPLPAKVKRVVFLAVLTVVGTLGLVGVLAWQGNAPWTVLYSGDGDSAAAANAAAIVNASPSDMVEYRLAPREYARYLALMLFFPDGPGIVAWLVLALAGYGAVMLIRRRIAMGYIVVAGILVTPLPFMILKSAHFYTERYFAISLPLTLVLVAAGIVMLAQQTGALAEYIVSRRNRVVSGGAVRCWGAGLMGGGLFVVLLPLLILSVGHYYRWTPFWDWKGVARQMSYTMNNNDVVYTGKSTLASFIPAIRGFYLPRFLENNVSPIYTSKWVYTEPSNKTLLDLFARFPESNIWFCSQTGKEEEMAKMLAPLPVEKMVFQRFYLWSLGEPTCNLVKNGDFEDADYWKPFLTPGTSIVREVRPGVRSNCLRLQRETKGEAVLRIDVNPPGHTVSNLGRNMGFEAWRRDMPVGWTVTPAGRNRLSFGEGASEGKKCVVLNGCSEEAVLRQVVSTGWAAGSIAILNAKTFVAENGQLQVGISYTVGGRLSRKLVFAPGGEQWNEVILSEPLPLNMDRGSLMLEVVRPAGAIIPAKIDDLRLSLQNVQVSLDPMRAYTLSMMLRYEDLRDKDETARLWNGQAGTITLSYREPNGKEKQQRLHGFYGNADWQYFATAIRQELDITPGATDFAVILALKGTGTIWVDNIQLEPKDHATPFVNGWRPPHDELAGLVPVGTAS